MTRPCTTAARPATPSPSLEVSPQPAAGHAVTIGPLRGRKLAGELVEQLDSLVGLRHCGRRLPRREYPSAYGQMGRCLSPCLGDLDPNLYRRRLDEALRLFLGGAGHGLTEHVERQMRAAAGQELFARRARVRPGAVRARRLAAPAAAAPGGDPGAPRRRARGHPRATAARERPASDRFVPA